MGNSRSIKQEHHSKRKNSKSDTNSKSSKSSKSSKPPKISHAKDPEKSTIVTHSNIMQLDPISIIEPGSFVSSPRSLQGVASYLPSLQRSLSNNSGYAKSIYDRIKGNKRLSPTTAKIETSSFTLFKYAQGMKANIVNESEEKTASPSNLNPIKINDVVIKIAADFWNEKINTATFERQLEIGVTIYLAMMIKESSIKRIFAPHFLQTEKIETIALKFLNMMGWLIRSLLRKDVDIRTLLKKLGTIHFRIGVKRKHFAQMLDALHETFTHYFTQEYRLQEQYAMDYLFALSTKLMVGDDYDDDIDNHKPIQDNALDYLSSLEICLKSTIGREYLFAYLRETWCDEMAIYLQSVKKFESRLSDKERFMVLREICDTSIDEKSKLAINISYEIRDNTMKKMKELNDKFLNKEHFIVANDILKSVNNGIYSLISQNHWDKFKKNIKTMNK